MMSEKNMQISDISIWHWLDLEPSSIGQSKGAASNCGSMAPLWFGVRNRIRAIPMVKFSGLSSNISPLRELFDVCP